MAIIFLSLLEALWGLGLFRLPVVFVRRQSFVFIQVTIIEKGLQLPYCGYHDFQFVYPYKDITAWSVTLYLNLRPYSMYN